MPNLVIVALPSEDDYIHKISSEKVPHMTLLFLGEVSKVNNLSSIIRFVEHASKTSLTRFGLEVERRAELGEDQADVLFFSKTKWSGYEDISTFRSHLLKNDNIRTAYDSTEQFPEWIPHITLGYPDSPAKEDTREHPGITYVSFDRIAVWPEEFEGIEFFLKEYEWDTAVAMGDVVQNILAHVSEKSWSSYKESDYSIEQWHAACLVHLHDGPPTSKSQCKLPVKTPSGALNRNGVHAAAAALAGARSPLKASSEQKAKAASALRRYYSQLGETPPDSLAQSAISDILEHHGVKGMKWGVRRKATVGAQEVIVSDRRKKLKTTGGKGHPATSEAVRARATAQIAKKSGVKAISNADLQAYNNRLNLEQNFHRLSYQDKSAGKKFVDKMLLKKGPGLAKSGAEMAMKDPRVRKKIATGAAAVAMRAAVVAA